MAAGHGKDAKVYIQGYDLSAQITNVTGDMSADVADISGLGSSSKSYVAGLRDATISVEGIFDGAVGMSDEVLQGILGPTTVIFNWLPTGDGLGKTAYGCQTFETAYAPTTPIGDAGKFTARLQATSAIGAGPGMERGVVLHPLQQEVATGNGASVDNGAATTAGGSSYLQATAAAGATVIKHQDAADNVTFADLVTFTSFAARTKERIAIVGTIRRYTRENRNTVPGGGSTYFTALTRN